VSICHAQGESPDLWEAIRRGESHTIQQYIAEGGDPNAMIGSPTVEKTRWPLLQVALYDREEDIAVMLLSAGADFESVDMPMDLLAGEGMPRFLSELLIRYPELLRDASPKQQASLLYPAASKGYYQVIDSLLADARRLGVDWDARTLSEAVAYAIDAKHEDIARTLLAAGARPDGSTVRLAARSGSPGMLRFLFSLGGDPNAALPLDQVDPGANSRTPMDFAWRRYNISRGEDREIGRMVLGELVRVGATLEGAVIPDGVLRDGSAELNAMEADSNRLIEAARFGYFEIASSLARGGDIDEASLRDALSMALRSFHNDIARMLIDDGALLSSGPLHAAAAGNSPGLLRLILQRGANPNERVLGLTPTEAWWERTETTPLRASSDYILHELIKGGADACWLVEHYAELNVIAANFLKNTATGCWSTAPAVERLTE